MANLKPKINKLLKALSVRGEKYTLEYNQFWSKKIAKLCTVRKLSKLVQDENGGFKKEEVVKYYNDIGILKELIHIYKGGEKVGGT